MFDLLQSPICGRLRRRERRPPRFEKLFLTRVVAGARNTARGSGVSVVGGTTLLPSVHRANGVKQFARRCKRRLQRRKRCLRRGGQSRKKIMSTPRSIIPNNLA